MKLRKSLESDVKNIMRIIHQAQEYFKEKGIDQWQNGYPNEETILKDISDDNSYVLLKEGKIVGTSVISFDGEETYDVIYDGKWLSSGKFAVIHRIAVDNECKGIGLSSEILKEAEKICLNRNINSIKIDTHEENLSMQKLLKKNDYKYCGTIYLEDDSKRIAFEKLL